MGSMYKTILRNIEIDGNKTDICRESFRISSTKIVFQVVGNICSSYMCQNVYFFKYASLSSTSLFLIILLKFQI